MNANVMFDQANSFYICAKLCWKELRNCLERFDICLTPHVVNLAFACELYLKTLLTCVNGGNILRAHKLNELEALLPEPMRESIAEAVRDKFPIDRDAFGTLYLDLISDAFAEWRYSYEKDALSCDIGFLTEFADALKETCSQQIYGICWDEYCRIAKINLDL